MMSAAFCALLLAGAGSGPGLAIEDRVSPFEPFHVSGPYANSHQCPVCEWGLGPMVIVWTQGKSPRDLEATIRVIDREIAAAPKDSIRAIVVDANIRGNDKASRKRMKEFANAWKTDHVYFMSRDAKTKVVLKDYKLSEPTKWDTFVSVSNNVRVSARFLNPTAKDEANLASAIRAVLPAK